MKKLLLALLFVFYTATLYAELPKVRIIVGPYLQAVTETSFTVVWTTDHPTVSWVEVAPEDGTHFYAEKRPRHYQTEHGKRSIGTIHRITISNLQAGTTYRYRVFSQSVAESGKGGRIVLGGIASSRVYRREPLRATTLDHSKSQVKFRVVNDIHGRDSIMCALLRGVDRTNADFVVFNGDMTSTIESETQIAAGFLRSAAKQFGAEVPILFVRGNHENRGHYSSQLINYFPTTSGRYYYTFRQGPVFGVVLDCGEDKPDSDIEYYGLADFDNYRTEEAAWLKKVVTSEAYRTAPLRIIFLHIPPVCGEIWHGTHEIRKKFMPLLQGTGVDLMLCGHLHKFYYVPVGKSEYDFPILINSNNDAVHVVAEKNRLHVSVIDPAGHKVAEYDLKK